MFVDGTTSLLDRARPLLETPPPRVDEVEAAEIARVVFGRSGEVRRLSGERDANFLIDGERPVVLKFVNDVEPDAEALMQVAALEHLAAATDLRVPAPAPDLEGRLLSHLVARSGAPLRARCYTYLPGSSAVSWPIDDRSRRAVGRTAGRLTRALSGFDHPAAERLNLWDTRAVAHLAPLMEFQPVSPLSEMLAAFLERFRRRVTPRVAGLRRQVIHNDLSPSNLVVGEALSVVDFGDMILAPIVCELAVAASYQITPEDPSNDLALVADAFDAEFPLTDEERELLPDFVLARLAGRILITRWRAERFPENHVYILRSSEAARALFLALNPLRMVP